MLAQAPRLRVSVGTGVRPDRSLMDGVRCCSQPSAMPTIYAGAIV